MAGLTAFFFVVFGIVGVELYNGALHHRCGESSKAVVRESGTGMPIGIQPLT